MYISSVERSVRGARDFVALLPTVWALGQTILVGSLAHVAQDGTRTLACCLPLLSVCCAQCYRLGQNVELLHFAHNKMSRMEYTVWVGTRSHTS